MAAQTTNQHAASDSKSSPAHNWNDPDKDRRKGEQRSFLRRNIDRQQVQLLLAQENTLLDEITAETGAELTSELAEGGSKSQPQAQAPAEAKQAAQAPQAQQLPQAPVEAAQAPQALPQAPSPMSDRDYLSLYDRFMANALPPDQHSRMYAEMQRRRAIREKEIGTPLNPPPVGPTPQPQAQVQPQAQAQAQQAQQAQAPKQAPKQVKPAEFIPYSLETLKKYADAFTQKRLILEDQQRYARSIYETEHGRKFAQEMGWQLERSSRPKQAAQPAQSAQAPAQAKPAQSAPAELAANAAKQEGYTGPNRRNTMH